AAPVLFIQRPEPLDETDDHPGGAEAAADAGDPAETALEVPEAVDEVAHLRSGEHDRGPERSDADGGGGPARVEHAGQHRAERGQDGQETLADLRLEVLPLRGEDLRTAGGGVGLAGELPLRVGRLLRDEREGRLRLSPG